MRWERFACATVFLKRIPNVGGLLKDIRLIDPGIDLFFLGAFASLRETGLGFS